MLVKSTTDGVVLIVAVVTAEKTADEEIAKLVVVGLEAGPGGWVDHRVKISQVEVCVEQVNSLQHSPTGLGAGNKVCSKAIK